MKEINELIDKIKLIPEGKEKDINIVYLIEKLAFLYQTKIITYEMYASYKRLFEKIFPISIKNINKEQDRQRNNLFMVKDKLTNLYKDILLFAKQYELSLFVQLDNTNLDEKINIVLDFFNWIDNDLVKIYNNMNKKGLIYKVDNPDVYGTAHKFGKEDFAITICPDYEGINQILALIHEMGHLYYYYILKDNQELSMNYVSAECISKTLERLFIDYLRENDLINRKLLNNYEYNRCVIDLLQIDTAYIVNNEIKDNNLKRDTIDLSINDYLRKSILVPTQYRNYRKFLRFDKNKYTYATLFSSVLENKFINDENYGKKFIKEYPLLAQELNSNELIDLFTKEEYFKSTTNNVERILTKTK